MRRRRSPPGLPAAPADECAREQETGLAADEHGGNFKRAVWQKPAQQKRGFAAMDVIVPDGAENDAVIEEHRDGAHDPR